MTLDEIDLGPGFPEWTELGQETGLDPLGMQRPIELVYQSLLPGISTITLRLRYYSFFAWLLEAYARKTGVTNDPEAFRRFQRRAEVLYALICARGELELGVAGIDWANRQLANFDPAQTGALIDFRPGADPDSDPSVRYLRNRGGAFGGIYASQMREMGLVKLDDPNLPVPFCKDAAIPLANGFNQSVGGLSEVFLNAVNAGTVTLTILDRLQPFKPSRIEPESRERRELAAILMARHPGAGQGDTNRSETLRMLLRLARRNGYPPKSEEAKWEWFGALRRDGMPEEISVLQPVWALYQASDLFRLAYETLLTAGLTVLKGAARQSLPIAEVVESLIDLAEPPDDCRLSDWFSELASGDGVEVEGGAKKAAQSMQEALAAGDHDEAVHAAWRLIATLLVKAECFDGEVLEWLGQADHFQSLVSETEFIKIRCDLPARTALSEILSDRVLRRHLWVASRKFRNQKAYTFLFEPDDGALRFRRFFQLSPSSPRIDQAVQFLRDVRFLDSNGVTELGLEELESA